MHLHRHEPLQPVRHGRALHSEHGLRNGLHHAPGRFHRGPTVAEEHRPVEHEVIVVRERHGVPDPGVAAAFQQLPVGRDGADVPVDRRLVVPALDVDVGGHVPQVARVGDESAQAIGGTQRSFRVRRHLEDMDVHVQQTGVIRFAQCLPRIDDPVQRIDHLQGVGALGGLARLEVPQSPGRAVHQRFGVQGAHVRVSRKRPVHLAHRRGVLVVPPAEVAGLGRRVAPGERLDQGPLDRGGVLDPIERLQGGVADGTERGPQLDRVELLPGLVVVGSGRVGDSPPRHRAVRHRARPRAGSSSPLPRGRTRSTT